jgi:4-hydroxybenzoate polyprenyltransferase
MSAAIPVPKTSTFTLLARDIKLAHSVFALPFGLLGAAYAMFARSGQELSWSDLASTRVAGEIGLIVACMVLARTWAMLVNRLADRNFDSENARTKRRAFASGAVEASTGWLVAIACAAAVQLAASGFGLFFANWWPAILALPVLAWLAAYSYTKRFTWLCHLWLGASLAAAPICAAIALHPASLVPPTPPTLWLIAAFVLMWVAGFDIIYALQDQDFDRERGLFSIPARLGWRNALWVSRTLHMAAFATLLAAWRVEPAFGWLWGAAVVLTAGLLGVEHAVMARLEAQALAPQADGSDNPPPALNLVFFTLNGVLSCLVGVLGTLQLVGV